jgi:hypothetical protein
MQIKIYLTTCQKMKGKNMELDKEQHWFNTNKKIAEILL